MKKNYSVLLAFFFFIIGFSLKAMEESFSSESSFSHLNRFENFEEFYKECFGEIFGFEKIKEVVKRFSFIFWYLKERNIGNILNFQSNQHVDFQEKQLTEEKINQIKLFFKDTVALIEKESALRNYLEVKEEKNFPHDSLFACFKKVFDEVELSEEYKKNQNKEIEDLTFLVKGVDDFTPSYIQQRVASDVHSSPEYFGLEYETIDFSDYDITTIPLEELYKGLHAGMKEKDVSFFCGDLADRDALYFFDEGNDGAWRQGKQWEERKNFFLYNLFKDYYHTVHAAWQFYCLHKNQSQKIKRWQVFGNHETKNIHQLGDYKNQYSYFSKVISLIRSMILPTEIYFIQSRGTSVLRHGFFTQKMHKENHIGKKVNKNFKFIYLRNKATRVYGEFSPFIDETYTLNPVYWSDHHKTERELDLNVLVAGSNDDKADQTIPFERGRGYYNPFSWKRGVDLGKQTSIENFKLLNRDNFLSDDELQIIQKSHWALFCGHSHNEHSLRFSAVKNDKKKTVSFHPYYVFDDAFLFHFCMCSHHNLFVQWFEPAFLEINTEKDLRIDWKSARPVHALETYSGDRWIKQKIATFPSVMKEFFMMLFDKKYPEQNKKKIRIKQPPANKSTEPKFPEKQKSNIQHEEINQRFNIKQQIAISLEPQSSEKADVGIQIERSVVDVSTQTEMKDAKRISCILENIHRNVVRSFFDKFKKPMLISHLMQAVAKKVDLEIETTNYVQPKNTINLTGMIGIGFLGASGCSVVRSIGRQGIKGFFKAISTSLKNTGKLCVVLDKKDIIIGGGGALLGYGVYSKFAPFFNQTKEDKKSNRRMKEN